MPRGRSSLFIRFCGARSQHVGCAFIFSCARHQAKSLHTVERIGILAIVRLAFRPLHSDEHCGFFAVLAGFEEHFGEVFYML